MANPLPSTFLPGSYDPTRPVAVVAGQRDYPWLTVESIRAAGCPVRLVALQGETNPDLIDSFPEKERAIVKVGQIGRMLKALRSLDAAYAIFVGQVSPGKLFRDLTPDLKAIRLLASLKERNAHTIFGAIAAEVEGSGIEMLDARAFMDAHLAADGLQTKRAAPQGQEDLRFGIRIAREMAAMDIGQSVVVRKGTVMAVEAFEGTDDMLARANKYKTDQLIFVKCARPQQNPHFDWPVFGERTLQSMHASGVRIAALEANRVVMLNRPRLLELADELAISIYGFSE